MTDPSTPPAGPHVSILPLGNSITIGDPDTYRYELFRQLTAANFAFDFVGSRNDNPAGYPGDWDMDHEGHGGWTTRDIDESLGNWLTGYTPDIVLLHLGTNDAFAIEGGEFTLEDSKTAMRSILSKLRMDNPQVKIYLAQILPITGGFSQVNPWVDTWNQALTEMASELSSTDSPIQLVDMNSRFGDADLYDGIHPDAAGARKMATVWAEAILN